MFASPSLRAALVLLTALTLTACGDENNTTTTNNTTATNNTTGGTNNTTSGTNNTTSGNNASTGGSNNNTGGTNNASTGGTNNTGCDEATKRAEVFGVNADVLEAPVSFEEVDGITTTTIDAGAGGAANAAASSFIYIDINAADGPEKLAIGDVAALDDDRWDLAFKRTEIRVNSGDSGPGTWLLATVQADWDAAEVPGPGTPNAWQTDEFVSETCELITYGRNTPLTAFGQWYSYDPATHTVSAPEAVTYFLYNTTTHAAYRLQITGYADAVYTVRWAPLGGA